MELSETIKVANLATGLRIALSAVRSQSMQGAGCDLGVAHQRVLLALNDKPLRMRDVCHIADIDKGQLSRAVTELQKCGLVSATYDQRRRLDIRLTERGLQKRNSVRRRIAAADASIMRRLSASERKALSRILQKLGAL